MMQECPYCFEENSDNATECRFCGKRIGKAALSERQKKESADSAEWQNKLKQIWNKYGLIVLVIIILVVIVFKVTQKENLNKNAEQATGMEPLKMDAPVAAVQEPAPAKEPAQAAESFSAPKPLIPTEVIYMYNDAVALCPGAKCTNPQKAVEYLSEAIRRQPDYANAYGVRANAYSHLKQYPQALEDYNKAIDLQPENSFFFNNRGNVYKDLNKYQPAMDDYNEAIHLKPEDAIAYYNRGNIYFIQGDEAAGCRDAQKACELGNCKLLEFGKEKKYCR